ncbi:MAG: ABC transporter substrate-binding protein [bacterium]
MLADSYDVSGDGLTYTFYLREGVKFHDGTEFTAEDVEFTYQRMLEVSPRKSNVDMIREIEVVDPHTIRFILSGASGPFLQATGMWFTQITPKEHTQAQLEEYGEIIEPVGTGPYKVVEWKKAQGIVRLAPFEDYKPRPEPASGLAGEKIAYFDEIVFEPIVEDEVRLLSLQEGEIDYAEQVPPEAADRLEANPDLVVESVPGTNWSALWFNVEKSPTDSKAMRQAMAYAVDYSDVNDAAFWGYGNTSNSLIPAAQASWRMPAHEIGYEKDLDRVEQLLEEAGYEGEEIVFETRSGEPIYDAISQNLQAQWKEAGINVTLNYLESAAHGASLYIRSRQDEIPPWHVGLLVNHAFRPDPDMHYYTRGHSAEHIGYWSNDEYDQLVERGRNEVDPEVRKEIYAEAHRIHIEEVPFLVLLHHPYIEAYQSYVKGVRVLDPHWDIFFGAWLDK